MLYKKHILLFLLINLFCQTPIKAGLRDSVSYSLDLKFHYGFAIPHYPNMVYIINDYIKGGELDLVIRRYRSNSWENNYNRLETGVGIWFSTLGRKDIYGNGVALYPFINIKMLQLGRLDVKSKVAFGLGYVNKPFDVGKNTFNLLMGSNINAYIGLGLTLYYPVSDKISLNSGLALTHMSNGSLRKPNNGINIATLSIGATYKLTPDKPAVKNIEIPAIPARELLFTVSAGRNQAVFNNPKVYWSGSITATHLWHKNDKISYGAGLDLIKYGGAPFAFNDYQHIEANQSLGFNDCFFMGAFGTAEFHLGSTALYLAPGVYLYHKTKPLQPVYARLGIRQKIAGNFLFHFGIKASYFVAEFLEFGVGYRFRYN